MTLRDSESRVVFVAEHLLFPEPDTPTLKFTKKSKSRLASQWDPDCRIVGILYFIEWHTEFGIEITTLMGADLAEAIEDRMEALKVPGVVTYVDGFETLARYALGPEVHSVWHNLDWEAVHHPKVIRLGDPDLFDLYEGYR